MSELVADIDGLPSKPDWMSRGKCDPSTAIIFFGKAKEGKWERKPREAMAKEICKLCPVVVDCGQYAFANKIDYGVWGGLTEMERRDILKNRGSS